MAFSGVVIDALSKEKIAYATIGLIEQNTGTNTNEQGNFTIKSNIYTDTLLITHIGYEPLKIALNKIKSANNFLLKRKQVLFNGIVVKKIIYSTQLNSFKHCSNNFYTSTGHYTQVAQLFTSPKENGMLT